MKDDWTRLEDERDKHNKTMTALLVGIAIAAMISLMIMAYLVFSSSDAKAWDIDKMNSQIEETNVIVNGVCSGTIISKEQRLVLTAYHCVDNLFKEFTEKVVDPKTNEIKEVTKQKLVPLKITTNKVRNFEIVATEDHTAKIVGSDADNDIALIQVIDIDYAPASAAPLAADTYSYKRGLKIYAVGNPSITFDNSITEGIISSPQRMLDIENRSLKVFQFSAGIIGGNSGGSLVNDDGEIIGTVSASLRGSEVSFAVPISYTKAMIIKAGFGSILPAKPDMNIK